MIKKYEDACREAEQNKQITAEQVLEIRRYFDAEQKKLKRENNTIESIGIEYFSISGAVVTVEGNWDYEIPDENARVEEEAIRNVELETLRGALKKLPREDREFLLTCYELCNDSLVARTLGMKRQTVEYRKTKLVEKLRKMILG